ncbi:hypothetical protein JOC95_000354 [Bacillus tianshenii]|uniref:Uncharacterized protein n=1 Tax=Sutcliffiella tianshenii TaxID=1463404 RepID=A0ABS2NVJ4_9BACI|nr:hypothetical protein [Bacillus tianshenii]MBM7618512.1 hypothetical protein [Bacillus tianshenii]
MSNKNVLQMICGILMFISFFSGWVHTGIYPVFPSELISASDEWILNKLLFFLLPVLGFANAFYGFTKKYKTGISLLSALLCITLMIAVYMGVRVTDFALHTGFYLVVFALISAIASVVVTEKKVNINNVSG